MTKYLLIVIGALTISAGVLGMQLRSELKYNGALEAEANQMARQLEAAKATNDDLLSTIADLRDGNTELLQKIADTETDKRAIAKDLETSNVEIVRELASEPTRPWAETPVPVAVADPLNTVLQRLYEPGTDTNSDHQGKDREAISASHLDAGLHSLSTDQVASDSEQWGSVPGGYATSQRLASMQSGQTPTAGMELDGARPGGVAPPLWVLPQS